MKKISYLIIFLFLFSGCGKVKELLEKKRVISLLKKTNYSALLDIVVDKELKLDRTNMKYIDGHLMSASPDKLYPPILKKLSSNISSSKKEILIGVLSRRVLSEAHDYATGGIGNAQKLIKNFNENYLAHNNAYKNLPSAQYHEQGIDAVLELIKKDELESYNTTVSFLFFSCSDRAITYFYKMLSKVDGKHEINRIFSLISISDKPERIKVLQEMDEMDDEYIVEKAKELLNKIESQQAKKNEN